MQFLPSDPFAALQQDTLEYHPFLSEGLATGLTVRIEKRSLADAHCPMTCTRAQASIVEDSRVVNSAVIPDSCGHKCYYRGWAQII